MMSRQRWIQQCPQAKQNWSLWCCYEVGKPNKPGQLQLYISAKNSLENREDTTCLLKKWVQGGPVQTGQGLKLCGSFELGSAATHLLTVVLLMEHNVAFKKANVKITTVEYTLSFRSSICKAGSFPSRTHNSQYMHTQYFSYLFVLQKPILQWEGTESKMKNV